MDTCPEDWHAEGVVKEVRESDDYYTITSSEGWSFGLKKSYGVIPNVNDPIEQRGEFGRPIKGIKIAGIVAFSKSDEEMAAEHQAMVTQINEDKKKAFAENREALDRDFLLLPEPFQAKIARLRAKNPEFRVEFESYEMFTCKEAVKIAKALGDAELVRVYAKADSQEQKRLVPDVDYENHSGNTHGMACQLAYIYLTNPEAIRFSHGALVHLVGCDDYKCHPLNEEELAVVEVGQ